MKPPPATSSSVAAKTVNGDPGACRCNADRTALAASYESDRSSVTTTSRLAPHLLAHAIAETRPDPTDDTAANRLPSLIATSAITVRNCCNECRTPQRIDSLSMREKSAYRSVAQTEETSSYAPSVTKLCPAV
ncbi:hypothetical protein [uncultured Duncaniella sp.]|uniref:hypothetical protein n=1 Tax=uncultured Duncaniella sp. TaxID=2768039 RepID=UPI002729D023|nr:hypothetical protein [uncultured Duncaniella sp.]